MGVVRFSRFDIVLVTLDPTQGAEIQKTRPCVVISPNELNHYIRTLVVAPMTPKSKPYPWRIPVDFQEKQGEIVLDQIRTIDKMRVVKKLGSLNEVTSTTLLERISDEHRNSLPCHLIC